ncbi:putative Golgi SNAP receptor complex member 1 [Trypanosoma cruzi]|uniref:Golgi SNARE protein-like, putative n=2 Tax=Trypanosoma cruzi TaxID=5693 RepID=Q4D726_TRYCC|nr:Golgi SNARE protein-like, putative [Trypanosoma cruzi]EAN88325.1 Golgi SNARE protein-like, putative [Trypanosoma cruzi]PWU92645.1 putative Golgi SNAP receptor complex member 1 [Trypanosoma cruzi]RNC48332.1 Golgi SNARE protein-like [Trypanosoma cruzi]|eukprot:XP_810176.1 Golgi SNARE protein-like [Trypanosoma cruzi strain CL Brener]
MESKLRVWESLRNDARQADSVIERQLNVLEGISRLGGNSGVYESRATADGAASSVARIEVAQREFDRKRSDVEMALQQFESLLETMAETARALPPESTAHSHTERFLQLAAEKRRAVTRLTADFKRRREWAELLPSVTHDLEAHREGEGVRFLMEEQDSLRHTQRRLNNILSQAESSRDQLRGQRDAFARMEDRLVQIALRVPVLKRVLGRISSKRRRDALVLGVVIGICMLLMILFW